MKAGHGIGGFSRRLAAVCVVGALLAAPALASAEEYTDEGSNPLRILYYVVYPVGKVLEYTVTRPLHAVAEYVAPYHHIDEKRFNGCSRERPTRNCTHAIR